MQRTADDGGIIISCDFCGEDWQPYEDDQSNPMIEGHKGSIICLKCLKFGLQALATGDEEFACRMCQREDLPADLPRWQSEATDAIICRDCVNQAAGTFSKDPDVDWKWRRNGGE